MSLSFRGKLKGERGRERERERVTEEINFVGPLRSPRRAIQIPDNRCQWPHNRPKDRELGKALTRRGMADGPLQELQL